MFKFKSIFKYLTITLLIAVSLSGIKLIKVYAGGEIDDPYCNSIVIPTYNL